MDYSLYWLTTRRKKIYEFLKTLKSETFFKALEVIKDDVLVTIIKSAIEDYTDEKIYELAVMELLRLPQEKQENAINAVLEQVKQECIPFRQKVSLLSKSEIKKALELSVELEKLYSNGCEVKLELMKEQKMITRLTPIPTDYSKVLNVEFVGCASRVGVYCRLIGFCELKDVSLDKVNSFEFLLKAIDELNKDQDYFEFEFSKDEE